MQHKHVINCDGVKLLLFAFMLLLQKWGIYFFSALIWRKMCAVVHEPGKTILKGVPRRIKVSPQESLEEKQILLTFSTYL